MRPRTGLCYVCASTLSIALTTAVRCACFCLRTVRVLPLPSHSILWQDYCNCNTPNFNNDKRHCFPLTGGNSTACLPDDEGGPGCCDTWPDADTRNDLDTECGAMFQGSNRLQRGLNFIDYLKTFYEAKKIAYSVVHGFFDGGHDFPAMAKSRLFRAWAFLP